MKNGYDQFFKSARANKPLPKKETPARKVESAEDVKKQVEMIKRKLAKNKTRKLKKQFPLGAGVALGLTLAVAFLVSQNTEKVEEVLSSIEIKILGTATAADVAEKSAATKDQKTENTASTSSNVDTAKSPTSMTFTPEEMALFKNLDERRRLLDLREAELKKMEEELHKQREDLEKRLAQVEDVRRSIANQLEEKVNVDKERVDQLVQFYSSMKPQQAAKVIETLNEDLAVEVLLKMKKKSAAEIMNLIDAQKAQRLSEKFAGYRRK